MYAIIYKKAGGSVMHLNISDKDIRLSLRDEVRCSEYIFESHSHRSYELIAVFEGNIDIVIGSGRYALSGGEIALIPPLVYHSVSTTGNVPYKRITVLIEPSFIPEAIRGELDMRISKSPIGAAAELGAPMSMLERIFPHALPARDMPLIRAFITEALYAFTYKSGTAAESRQHPTVRAICEYVDAHVCEKITLDAIAAELFMSKSSVCHIFRREMKISPKQYVLQKKLAYAAGLISGGMPATEAASAIGYGNYANFYKAYRSVFGVSPTGRG